MFGFLKKLFGGDAETNRAAGIQIEQVAAPYKVPEPAAETPIPLVTDKVAEVNARPIIKPAAEPVKQKSARAPRTKAPAKPKAATTAAKKPAKRKPKSTT